MKYFFILIASFMLGTSCGTNNAASQEFVAKDLAVQDFWEQINSLDNEQLLDVRTPDEWSEGIIPGAMKANWHDQDFLDQVSKLDKDKAVYVYCRSGGRSGQAMLKMKEAGYREIYNLTGGMMAWQAAGLDVSK